MKVNTFFLTLFFAMALIGCSSAKKDKGDFQVMIVEAPLQCEAEPKELRAECKCPKTGDSVATTISAIGSVIGNLITTLWD